MTSRVRRVLLATLLLFASGMVVMLYGRATSSPRRQSFFVASADLRDASRILVAASDETAPVQAHHVVPGAQIVLGERVVHDSTYEKLTLRLIPTLPVVPAVLTLGSSGEAIAIYSSGRSSSPDAGCHGFLRGVLRVLAAGDERVTAEVDAVIARAAPGSTERCVGSRIRREVEFPRKELHELTSL